MPGPGEVELRRPTSRLASIRILARLPEADLIRIERSASWRRYRKGEQILESASPSREVFFVVEGSVDIVNYARSGREVAYGTLPAGRCFGELSAIDGEPRSAAVVAGSDCLIAAIAPGVFQGLLRQHPDFAIEVLSQLARVVRSSDERIMNLATLGAVQRVAQELLGIARQDPIVPSQWSIYPVPTQQDIARRAATTRETVTRVLAQLEARGLIRRKGKALYIKDRAELENAAERLAAPAP
jgi:CRP-like cAMP-binding protein